MDKNQQILSLIGLCLRGRNLEVGEEPVEAVARARDARVLLLASDAADNTIRRVKHFAEIGQCAWLQVPFTKQELGRATGRTSAAVAAVTNIGLAVAIVRRLAETDPVRYDADLAKLELKAKRAAERKSEAAQHEKNLRRGIKRSKKADESGGATDGSRKKNNSAEGSNGSAKSGSRNKVPEGGTRRPGAGRNTPSAEHKSRKEGGSSRPARQSGSRPYRGGHTASRGKPNPYAHSRPVKKGKGSFRKKED